MINVVVIGVIALLVAAAGTYIYSEKKKGRACIGCPSAGKCQKCCCGQK